MYKVYLHLKNFLHLKNTFTFNYIKYFTNIAPIFNMKLNILLAIFILLSGSVQAQKANLEIKDFEIKESLTGNNKIAIVAIDSLHNSDESIRGTYKFIINGFEQNLKFNDGAAVATQPIESSTFAYFKHKNQNKSFGKLYFLYKKEKEILPIKINGLALVLIPVIILFIAYAMKRFISTFVILAILYSYFSLSKGLSITQIIESALDVFKKIL